MPRTSLVIAALASLALAPPERADACSAPLCRPGAFVPADGAQVPANVPGLFWRPTPTSDGSPADPSRVTLTTTADATPLPFTASALPDGDFVLVPDDPLIPGTSYVLTDTTQCGGIPDVGPRVTFHAGPVAPLPDQLGTLAATPLGVSPLEIATISGSCSSQVTAAQVDVELALEPAVVDWLPALHFVTLVDGRPYTPQTNIREPVAPGESWIGRGADRLFAICHTDDTGTIGGLAPGPHVVTMEARLPGTSEVLTSSSVTIELDCEPAEPGDPGDDDRGGGCSAGGHPTLLLGVLLLLLRRRS